LEKATPLAQTRLESLAEADRIFFEMALHGWHGSSYSKVDGRVCRTFVWNFLCQLLGECPAKEIMPLNFMTLDKQSALGSVFDHPEFVMPNGCVLLCFYESINRFMLFGL
jgi:hypothetical protein